MDSSPDVPRSTFSLSLKSVEIMFEGDPLPTASEADAFVEIIAAIVKRVLAEEANASHSLS
jgi:hypothetical protein